MIEFRQKEFAHVKKHAAKAVVANATKVADKIGESKLSVKFRKALTSDPIKRRNIGAPQKASRRSQLEAGINTVDGTAKKVSEAANYVRQRTPGELVSEVPQVVLDKGVVASGLTALGYAPLAYGIYVPGTTAVAFGAEVGLRRKFPGYVNASSKAAERYRDGKAKKVIRKATDAVYNMCNTLRV